MPSTTSTVTRLNAIRFLLDAGDIDLAKAVVKRLEIHHGVESPIAQIIDLLESGALGEVKDRIGKELCDDDRIIVWANPELTIIEQQLIQLRQEPAEITIKRVDIIERLLQLEEAIIKVTWRTFDRTSIDVILTRLKALTAQQSEGSGLKAGEIHKFGKIDCVWCPPGQFVMGSPISDEERWKWSDEDQYNVVLTRGFFLAKSPCTNAHWQEIMTSSPSENGWANSPVENVRWQDVVDYCKRLTEKHRAEGVLLDGWEWRLPTEAEWEYAARAGTSESRYGKLGAIAWYSDNSDDRIQEVNQKQPNPWGLYDMLGNVWELCSDWYDSYDYETGCVTDPMGTPGGFCRVIRGGCWLSTASEVRASQRNQFRVDPPEDGYLIVGFRPALSRVRLETSATAINMT
jgi:hypothetical protein